MKQTSSFLFSLLGMAAIGLHAQERPNIVYIMCDDMGYGDLGCYGQQLIATPNIDNMARHGLRFTDAYAGSPVSAPSRATFMTGQHSGHTHVRGNREYWNNGHYVQYGENTDFATVGQEPYDTAHVIIPEIFHDNGYRVGMFGKWAGGYEGSVSTPEKRGVDDFYGYICQFQAHLYYPNFLNEYHRERGDTAVRRVVLEQNVQHAMYGKDYDNRQQYSADMIHQEALKWLDTQQKGKPFLGIFTYTLPHAELRQPNDSILQAYRGRFAQERVYKGSEGSRYNPTNYGHAEFAAMITRLDAQVGEILSTLSRKGLLDNTLVVFTSDNGPHEEGGADPTFFNRDGKLRGIKRSTHEGGIRIPFIAYWRGKIKPGVSHLPFAFYDLMPTFCDIAHIKDYEQRYTNPRLEHDYFDGISIAPTLLGHPAQQKYHDHLYWEFHETDMMALRQGNWKLVVRKGVPHLYNLSTDLHEDYDIAKLHPQRVERMIKILRKEHTKSDHFKITLPQCKEKGEV